MAPIVAIQVARVGELLRDRKIALELTDGARDWLGRVGYDPVYGARPLKRAVQRHLPDSLADRLLAGEVLDGSTVRVDEGEGSWGWWWPNPTHKATCAILGRGEAGPADRSSKPIRRDGSGQPASGPFKKGAARIFGSDTRTQPTRPAAMSIV